MSTGSVVFLLVGAGLGTYLLRYLPMRWYVTLETVFQRPTFKRVLSALGPAAIVALLVVSLVGLTHSENRWSWQSDELRMGVALMAMLLSRYWYKNTIVTTFVGVMSYGLILWLQQGEFSFAL